MERVYTTDQRAFSDVQNVAVALKSTGPAQRHIGILHRNRDTNQVLLLDLAWHIRLRNDPPGAGYVWVDPLMSTREARQVAMVCRKVWRGNQKGQIPYGFSVPNDCFDELTGEFLLGPTQYGLTCATFVVAIFGTAGLFLLDLGSWPERPDDAVWQRQIVDLLRRHGASEEHLKLVESDVGCIRIRPEEVGGAAALSMWPASFIDATRVGSEIVELLNAGELVGTESQDVEEA